MSSVEDVKQQLHRAAAADDDADVEHFEGGNADALARLRAEHARELAKKNDMLKSLKRKLSRVHSIFKTRAEKLQQAGIDETGTSLTSRITEPRTPTTVGSSVASTPGSRPAAWSSPAASSSSRRHGRGTAAAAVTPARTPATAAADGGTPRFTVQSEAGSAYTTPAHASASRELVSPLTSGSSTTSHRELRFDTASPLPRFSSDRLSDGTAAGAGAGAGPATATATTGRQSASPSPSPSFSTGRRDTATRPSMLNPLPEDAGTEDAVTVTDADAAADAGTHGGSSAHMGGYATRVPRATSEASIVFAGLSTPQPRSTSRNSLSPFATDGGGPIPMSPSPSPVAVGAVVDAEPGTGAHAAGAGAGAGAGMATPSTAGTPASSNSSIATATGSAARRKLSSLAVSTGRGPSSEGGGSSSSSMRALARRQVMRRITSKIHVPPLNCLWGWGFLPYSVEPVAAPSPVFAVGAHPVKQVAVGEQHALMLCASGDVYQWDIAPASEGSSAEQVAAAAAASHEPRWIPALGLDKAIRNTLVVHVACGDAHCVALTDRGSLLSWGAGHEGQLGHGDFASGQTPRVVTALSGTTMSDVACGAKHTVAIASTGSVYSWGKGANGRLGHGDGLKEPTPRAVDMGEHEIQSVACGASFTVVLDNEGSVLCWGKGRKGECGQGACEDVWVPTLLRSSPSYPNGHVRAISCGYSHSLLLTDDDAIYSWGYNSAKQLGHSSAGVARVALGHCLQHEECPSQIAAGAFHSVAVTDKGNVITWGHNKHCQLGLGDARTVSKPKRLSLPAGISAIQHVAAATHFTIVVPVPVRADADAVASPASSPDSTIASLSGRRKSLAPTQRGSTETKEFEERSAAAVSKWHQLLKNWDRKRHVLKVHELWRKGIPVSVRPIVWPLAIGNPLRITPALFAACEKTVLAGPRSTKMDVDLNRMFPYLQLFDQHGSSLRDMLQLLLEAHQLYRPDLGYAQGMMYLASMLCMHVHDNYLAFQCFANLMSHGHLPAFFQFSPVVDPYYAVFDLVLAKNNKAVHRYMLQHRIDKNVFLFQWLQTLFLKVVPLDTAARIWDCFFLDGTMFCIRTAVALLTLLAPTLLKVEPEDTLMLLSFHDSYVDVWAVATQEATLFKAIDAVVVGHEAEQALSRLVNDVYFYGGKYKEKLKASIRGTK